MDFQRAALKPASGAPRKMSGMALLSDAEQVRIKRAPRLRGLRASRVERDR